MNQERLLREILEKQKEIESLISQFESIPLDEEDFDIKVEIDNEPRSGRSYSVCACVTYAEKQNIDRVCDMYVKKRGWRVRRGSLLRLVWLYFLDNHKSIDLSPYRD